MQLSGGFIWTGERGSGKSLGAVSFALEYLMRGCPIATNLDIYSEYLPYHDSIIYRIPDMPTSEHLDALPLPMPRSYKKADKNGLLLIDEAGLSANSRKWNQKGRDDLIAWLLQSRKLHWDLIIIIQDYEMLDNQMRNSLCDYLVLSARTDKMRIPYLGRFLDWIGLSATYPKVHKYYFYYGNDTSVQPQFIKSVVGISLYNAYDTNQLFKSVEFSDYWGISSQLPRATIEKFAEIKADLIQKSIDDYQSKISDLLIDLKEINLVAKKPKMSSSSSKFKLYAAAFVFVAVAFSFFSGKKIHVSSPANAAAFRSAASVPAASAASVPPVPAASVPAASAASVPPVPAASVPAASAASVPAASVPVASAASVPPVPAASVPAASAASVPPVPAASVSKQRLFIDTLMQDFTVKCSGIVWSDSRRPEGQLVFLKDGILQDTQSFRALREFGVTFIRRGYGVDVITPTAKYPVFFGGNKIAIK